VDLLTSNFFAALRSGVQDMQVSHITGKADMFLRIQANIIH
jgi:hypothetical protein